MNLNRRDFVKWAGATGLTIPAWALIPQALAAPYAGKILIDIHASGGIDQSSWTDPRETDKNLNDYALTKSALVIGNLRIAPMADNASFFNKYYQQMLVINGINAETNAHADGARCQATGRLDIGYPHLDELYAQKFGGGLPMPWLNYDESAFGYAKSIGLVPPTAMPTPTQFKALLQPNSPSGTQNNMKPADFAKGLAAREQRLKALQMKGDLPPRWGSINDQFLAASESRSLMAEVISKLPTSFSSKFAPAHVGLIAAYAGVTSAIQITSKGFDTHDNHTVRHEKALVNLTDLVDFVWQTAGTLGIANRIFLRIFSEFGRTGFNATLGKDHLGGAGTMILMEASPSWGNRVVGATGPKHQTLKINPGTGAISSTGVTITPRHIHLAIRKYLNIQTSDARFDLKVPTAQEIDFFNPSIKTPYPNI